MLRRLAIPSIAFAAVLSSFIALPAAALPTIALATGGANPSRAGGVQRDQNHLPDGVSFDDCVQDVTYQFTLTATDFVTGAESLQVWAGTGDCTDTTSRSAVTSGTCLPVSVPIQLTSSFVVVVRGRDLVRASLGQPSPGNGGLVASPASAADDSICHVRASSAGTPMNVSFLVFSANAGNDAEVALTYVAAPNSGLDIVVDTVGPPPVSSPSVQNTSAGDLVSWTPPDDGSDLAGFQLFCEVSPMACPAAPFVGNVLVDPKSKCGAISDKTATAFRPVGLQPNTQYGFRVGGFDLMGNLGPVAEAGCAITGADGAGDGGANAADPNARVAAGCACDVSGSTPFGGAASAAGLGLVALAITRRRNRRAR